jgi:hypothetical protein
MQASSLLSDLKEAVRYAEEVIPQTFVTPATAFCWQLAELVAAQEYIAFRIFSESEYVVQYESDENPDLIQAWEWMRVCLDPLVFRDCKKSIEWEALLKKACDESARLQPVSFLFNTALKVPENGAQLWHSSKCRLEKLSADQHNTNQRFAMLMTELIDIYPKEEHLKGLDFQAMASKLECVDTHSQVANQVS